MSGRVLLAGCFLLATLLAGCRTLEQAQPQPQPVYRISLLLPAGEAFMLPGIWGAGVTFAGQPPFATEQRRISLLVRGRAAALRLQEELAASGLPVMELKLEKKYAGN